MKNKQETYNHVLTSIQKLIEGETDEIAIMATIVCELHHSFDYFHWTGFYRVTEPGLLKIGPYQGTHGCLRIPFDKGVCGAAARTKLTQLVHDVTQFPGHIACSSKTQSEIVIPILNSDGQTIAVLDIDSNQLNAFDEVDRVNLEKLCRKI